MKTAHGKGKLTNILKTEHQCEKDIMRIMVTVKPEKRLGNVGWGLQFQFKLFNS